MTVSFLLVHNRVTLDLSHLNGSWAGSQDFVNSIIMKILYTALFLALPVALAATTTTAPQETPPAEKDTGTPARKQTLIVGPTKPTRVNLVEAYGLGEAPYLSSLPSITLSPSTTQAPQSQPFFSWVALIEINQKKLDENTTALAEATKIAVNDFPAVDEPDSEIGQAKVVVNKSPTVATAGEDVFADEVLAKEGPGAARGQFSIQLVIGHPQDKEKATAPGSTPPQDVPSVPSPSPAQSEQQQPAAQPEQQPPPT